MPGQANDRDPGEILGEIPAIETLAIETLAIETLAIETLAIERLAIERLAIAGGVWVGKVSAR
jgi:hypothetical protein